MILLRLVLLDDLLQQVDVIGERLFARGGQGTGSERAVVLKRFGYGDISRLLERADVRGQVAIGHVQGVAHFGEGKINAIGQMKQTEEKSHDAIGIIAGPVDEVGNADRKQTASAEDEGPAENFHPARHEETGSVKGAPIKDDPTQG